MRLPVEDNLDRAGVLIGPAMIVVLILVMSGWTGRGMPHLGVDALLTLAGATSLVLAWVVAAIGFGWPLRVWLAPRASEPAALQIALGIAAMLFLNSALGRLGALQVGGSVGAWTLIVVGGALVFEQIRRGGLRREVNLPKPHWMIWTASPAIAVLLLATTSAPGWLWDTEYGGYDALSYHLQLPKEWLALGAITPVEHSVYSFFPGAMEAAYYHLMVMGGDAVAAVYACQMLHAAMGLIAAWVVWRVVVQVANACAKPQAAWGGAAAFVIVLGTPWASVAGSLAYNEMAMLLMLAAGILVIAEGDLGPLKRASMVGVFAGTACAAKLTAIGFVAAPLGVLLLSASPRRAWIRALPIAIVGGALALGPYLMHNTIAASNPVFPFATGVFGTAHWDGEQAAIWREAHRSDLPVRGRAVESWHQVIRFGIGERPAHVERWHPQWSILPWLMLAALAILVARPATRRWGILLLTIVAIQFVFWIALTHIKSRFMLPMVVPGAMAIALACASCARKGECACRPCAWWMLACAGVTALLFWSVVSVYVFAKQTGGAPAARVGMARVLSGEDLTPTLRERLGRSDSPAIYLSHVLPEHSRVLFIGEAAPFYFSGEFTYNTVWDRGPLSRLMREHPDDPHAWLDRLREEGYTYVFVNPVMLVRWEDARWNDPLLTLDRVMMAMQAGARPEHRWPRGEMLFSME